MFSYEGKTAWRIVIGTEEGKDLYVQNIRTDKQDRIISLALTDNRRWAGWFWTKDYALDIRLMLIQQMGLKGKNIGLVEVGHRARWGGTNYVPSEG